MRTNSERGTAEAWWEVSYYEGDKRVPTVEFYYSRDAALLRGPRIAANQENRCPTVTECRVVWQPDG
jgi:hypothetical protein